jgi:hypothetical protein
MLEEDRATITAPLPDAARGAPIAGRAASSASRNPPRAEVFTPH